jgi:hypothetical protein
MFPWPMLNLGSCRILKSVAGAGKWRNPHLHGCSSEWGGAIQIHHRFVGDAVKFADLELGTSVQPQSVLYIRPTC